MAEVSKARLIALAEEKLASARLLLAEGHSGDAYYLAGYAAELMLKAVSARQFRAETLPDRKLVQDLYTHRLDKLQELAGLADELKGLQKSNPEFSARWELVTGWSEEARYGDYTRDQAAQLIEALDEPSNGVMQWLRQHLEPPIDTVAKLVDFIEADGFGLDAAVWTQDEADRWRLFLLPRDRGDGTLRSMVHVAHTLSAHADELPGREDIRYSVVEADDPVIKAMRGLKLGKIRSPKRVDGILGAGRYIDRAYVLRLN